MAKTTVKWTLSDTQRGRTPNWVLEQTKCKNKAEIIAKHGSKKVFTREA